MAPSPSEITFPPYQGHCVSVSAINGANARMLSAMLVTPPPTEPNLKYFKIPVFSFLIASPHRKQKVLFDLAFMKDMMTRMPPAVAKLMESSKGTGSDDPMIMDEVTPIPDALTTQATMKLEDINAVIWSHGHFDHTGDPGAFPKSTELIVGPGAKDKYMPGYPTNPDAMTLDSFFEGRNMRELDFGPTGTAGSAEPAEGSPMAKGMKDKLGFVVRLRRFSQLLFGRGGDSSIGSASESNSKSKQPLTIGGFPAFDYFDDGSLYLLHAPGHTVDHMCALARTTPDTFVLMTGDAFHNVGHLRPNAFRPLPETVPAAVLGRAPPPDECPCAVHYKDRLRPAMVSAGGEGEEEQGQQEQPGAFFDLAPHMQEEMEKSQKTLARLKAFDGRDDVFVLAAHDLSLLDVVDVFPKELNGWKEKGWGDRARWAFLKYL